MQLSNIVIITTSTLLLAAVAAALSIVVVFADASLVVDSVLDKRDGLIERTKTVNPPKYAQGRLMKFHLAYAVPSYDLAQQYWDKKITKQDEATQLVSTFYNHCKGLADHNWVYAYLCDDPDPKIQVNKGVINYLLLCYETDKKKNIDWAKDHTQQIITDLKWTAEEARKPGERLMAEYEAYIKHPN